MSFFPKSFLNLAPILQPHPGDGKGGKGKGKGVTQAPQGTTYNLDIRTTLKLTSMSEGGKDASHACNMERNLRWARFYFPIMSCMHNQSLSHAFVLITTHTLHAYIHTYARTYVCMYVRISPPFN